MYSSDHNLPMSPQSIDDAAAADSLYKGWILMCDESSLAKPLYSSHTERYLHIETIKWLPKYAVASREDKLVYLFNGEPSPVELATLVGRREGRSSTSSTLSSAAAANVHSYRLDNSVKLPSFLSYWHNKSPKYEETVIKSELTGQPSKDSDSLHSFQAASSSNGQQHDSSNNSTVSSSNSTFRFAGLFFKKDKSDKVKHSSLKRAKSGIQLERKKTGAVPGAGAGGGESTANSSSATTPTTDTPTGAIATAAAESSPQQPKHRHSKIENRQSLPSPMRPSRSHESLSSPLKATAPPFPAKKGHKNSTDDHHHHQTAADHEAWSSGGSSGSGIVKLHLQGPQVHVHAVHASLLSEENCFEVKCARSSVRIIEELPAPGGGGSSSFSYENNETFEDGGGAEEPDDHAEAEEHQRRKHSHKSTHRPTRRKSRRDQSTNGHHPAAGQVSESPASAGSRLYFMCRSGEEREKWLQCLASICKPNELNEAHEESSLQLWLLEAKGQPLSAKTGPGSKKYMCEIVLNKQVLARTCSKEKRDMLFWGEHVELSSLAHAGDHVRIELYQETPETSKKKSHKRDTLHSTSSSSGKDPAPVSLAALVIGAGKGSSLVRSTKQVLLGYVNIPVSSIDAHQPVEKWYCLETPTSTAGSNYDLTSTATGVSGLIAANHLNSSNLNLNTCTTDTSSSSLTTQGFSKSAISIRIKAKYQSLHILPVHCYDRLVRYLTHNYMHLMQTLEPHLPVRLKDDLASVFVRVAHKLRIQVRFLVDLIGAEVLSLADSSLTFRGNSLATKSIESYMKLVGESYLKQTLSDCIRSIIDTTNDLEIDPSKVANQAHLVANREELVQVLHLVCGRVLNSCVNFPLEMKFVFAKLRELCRRHGKTDEMCDTLISASIFLRFICPAILSPNLFNLTQEYPQEKAARKLTLAAKTLQTIANFSKFGGAKEFYMSFDKMNQFVDEHTCLMREFLRNISTLGEQDLASLDESTQYLRAELEGPDLDRDGGAPMEHLKTHLAGPGNGDLKFTAEFIDLGKQLSVLQKLLNSIFDKLDEPVRHRCDELLAILDELEHLKAHPSAAADQLKNTTSNAKVLSYENRLHFKNTPAAAAEQSNSAGSSVASLTPPLQQQSSSSSDSHYSSQLVLNINPTCDSKSSPAISAARLITGAPQQQKQLETEIGALKARLRETEQSLKKEQTEKYLIEYKLKQQQQDNDQQMKNIINRLIKVEEELRKEQSEMHKILKAKQDLIEIQKKRIEFLSGRQAVATTKTQAPTTGSLNGQHPSAGYNQHAYLPKSRAAGESETTESSQSVSPLAKQDSPLHAASAGEFKPQQIAASPSSSSSSMTQFCSYLASNSSLMTVGQDRQPQLRKLLSGNNNSNSSSSSSSQERGAVVKASSTESPPLPTSASSHQLSGSGQYTHFLRTSEL